MTVEARMCGCAAERKLIPIYGWFLAAGVFDQYSTRFDSLATDSVDIYAIIEKFSRENDDGPPRLLQ